MANVKTTALHISIPTETVQRLKAINRACNGTLHNTASRMLDYGIETELLDAPESFLKRYQSALDEERK